MANIKNRIFNDIKLSASIEDCKKTVTPILQRYLANFPDFTDHSVTHSECVIDRVSDILGNNIFLLNKSEIYILLMSCYLHDIGMSPTKEMQKLIKESEEFKKETKKGCDYKEYIRRIHHQLSYEYIIEHWKNFNIINHRYAKAIALVSLGHREEELLNFEQFDPKYPVESGTNFVCIPFLASILRLADELDLTNERTPDLLFNEYFPDDRIGKREWDKHKANSCVNFSDIRIIITSKCSNPSIYRNLLKQYQKIEKVLNNTHKIIRSVPQRKLKIDYTKVEKNISTEGFTPKDIGFSFDLQNTLNTFIGRNIYSKKYVAIREILQNAIDACRYKKIDRPKYNPLIKIILDNGKLIIKDNGLGMDEFIVEKYFSCLARSIYTEKKVAQEFESISQFGIGIFSYFLLCDRFDVETKMKKREPLKFRVTKDAETHFFFFDKPKIKNEGTTISLYLNETLLFSELVKWVKYFIRFVEIPIVIKSKNRKEKIISQTIKPSKQKNLRKMINILHEGEAFNLTYVSEDIKNDTYEGICSLIIAKHKKIKYKPKSLYEIIEKDDIEISQKGIYVTTSKGHLQYLVGRINLKKKNELNLSRIHINDERFLSEVLSDFETRIIYKIFNNWQRLSPEKKANLTKDFIDNYLSGHDRFLPSQLINKYLTCFTVAFYYKGKINYIFLKDFLRFRKFLLVCHTKAWNWHSTEERSISDIKKISQRFNIPILLINKDVDDKFFYNLLNKIGFYHSITSDDNNWFFFFTNKKTEFNTTQLLPGNRHEGLPFLCKDIAAFPHIDTNVFFNLNHSIIKYILRNNKNITQSQAKFSLWNQFLEILRNFMFNLHVGGINKPTHYLNGMNKVLKKINKTSNTKFKLTKTDFSPWISSKFK